jgi:hypothetical protein
MLRDRHDRINTISFVHGKLLPNQREYGAGRSLKRLLRCPKSFLETSVTPFLQPATGARRLPVGSRNATNGRPRRNEVGW